MHGLLTLKVVMNVDSSVNPLFSSSSSLIFLLLHEWLLNSVRFVMILAPYFTHSSSYETYINVARIIVKNDACTNLNIRTRLLIKVTKMFFPFIRFAWKTIKLRSIICRSLWMFTQTGSMPANRPTHNLFNFTVDSIIHIWRSMEGIENSCRLHKLCLFYGWLKIIFLNPFIQYIPVSFCL